MSPWKSFFYYTIGRQNAYILLDVMLIYMLISDVQETSVFKTSTHPKKSAAEGGRLLRSFFRLLYNHFLDFQNRKYRYWVYLMEHIFFDVQLCIKISFFKEFCENWYTYHPVFSRRPVWNARTSILEFRNQRNVEEPAKNRLDMSSIFTIRIVPQARRWGG